MQPGRKGPDRNDFDESTFRYIRMRLRSNVADHRDFSAVGCETQGVVLHAWTAANVPQNHNLNRDIELKAAVRVLMFAEIAVARLDGVFLGLIIERMLCDVS